MRFEATVEGGEEIAAVLRAMDKSVSGKYLAQSVSAALTPIQREARRRAPKGSRMHRTYKGRLVAPGHLSRSIRKRVWRSKDGHFAAGRVGPSSEAWYGLLFGSSVQHNRRFPQDDWLTDSARALRSRTADNLKKQLLKRLERAAKTGR